MGIKDFSFNKNFNEITLNTFGQYKVNSIDVNDIMLNPKNFYSTEKSDIKDLQESIEEKGLLQPIVVRYDETAEKYIILSGHRRYISYTDLKKDDGSPKYETIPAHIVEVRDEDEEMMYIISSNSTTRELSSWEKMQQVNILSDIYKKRREKGDIKGRKVEFIAEETGMSSRQAQRIVSISENISDLGAQEIKNGNLSIVAATTLVKYDKETQDKVIGTFDQISPQKIKQYFANKNDIYQSIDNSIENLQMLKRELDKRKKINKPIEKKIISINKQIHSLVGEIGEK